MTAETGAPDPGTVYLLHFDRPYVHAAHYCGWTDDLDTRLADHAAGRGARLMAVIREAGIGWQLARTWSGTRARERALKRQGGASRRCPLCGVNPRSAGASSEEAGDDIGGQAAEHGDEDGTGDVDADRDEDVTDPCESLAARADEDVDEDGAW